MSSRTYALIDGTSRRNYYGSQANANLGYWDDPSYYNPPSKLRSNTDAYKDTALEKELLEPKKFGTPYLSHEEITRIVSKQFASDIYERSYASSGSGGRSNFALVFVASTLAAMGLMDSLTFIAVTTNYVKSDVVPVCLKWNSLTASHPTPMVTLVWVWITAGIWASILPLILGFIGECSKQSSNADYVHTFDPVLRIDGSNGQNAKTEKLYKTLTILSIVVLILGFICGIIDCVLFSGCFSSTNSFPMKYIPSILVCLLCLSVIIILLVLWRARQGQSRTNSNYDRRDYDMTLNYGLYYDNKSVNESRPIMAEFSTAVAAPGLTIPAPTQPSQPLVTIVDQAPAYPIIPAPPPPPSRPLGPPIFAGAPRLPVRAMPYQRPMMYQMPHYSNY